MFDKLGYCGGLTFILNSVFLLETITYWRYIIQCLTDQRLEYAWQNDVNEHVQCNRKFSFWNFYLLKVSHTVPNQYDNMRLGVKINILLLILHVISSRFLPGISESAPGDGYSCPLQHSSCVRVVVWYCGEPISHHQAFVWHFLKETHIQFNKFKNCTTSTCTFAFQIKKIRHFYAKMFKLILGNFFTPWSFVQWKL